MTFRLRVTIYKTMIENILVTSHLSQDNYTYAQASIFFEGPATRQMELDVSSTFLNIK